MAPSRSRTLESAARSRTAPETPSKKKSPPATFEGFADAKMSFFRALEKHQDREWFAAHKAEYEEGWAKPMALLLDAVHAKIDGTFTHCDLTEPKVFRIYRDVRFSKDKSPYKTHVAGGIGIGTKTIAPSAPSALYVHLGIENGKPSTFAGSGQYGFDGPALARYRKALLDPARAKELTSLLAKLEKKGFTVASESSLQRPPKGFEDHPLAELAKRKGLVVDFGPIPAAAIPTPKLATWLVERAKLAAPLVEWVTFATA
ncbi:MAG: DUF2461 domain-containing protein [Polyangiaceae bacterium]